jgi:hypothetical protein
MPRIGDQRSRLNRHGTADAVFDRECAFPRVIAFQIRRSHIAATCQGRFWH